MRVSALICLGALSALLAPCGARAQTINQTFVFGDSTVDSGWWKGAFAGLCDGAAVPCTPNTNPANPKNVSIFEALSTGTTNGAPVGAGYVMNSQLLASYFGTKAEPANQPGGTNYAISGAVDNNAGGKGNLNQNPNLPSTVQQIANYLAASGGVANPSALYYVSSGGNDFTFATQAGNPFANNAQRDAFLTAEATALVNEIKVLSAAGAKYIVVDSLHGPGATNPANVGTLGYNYVQTLWNGLAQAGINFIPADVSSMVRYIQANPTVFGFTAATVSPGDTATGLGAACVRQSNVSAATTTGWGQWCINSTVPTTVNVAYLAAANSEQTYLYSDDQHFSAAGQKIEADYIYSLIVAPSQISMLAENAVKTQTAIIANVQRQIDASYQNQGNSPFNVWVSGDVSRLAIDNYPNFPNDPSYPLTLASGFTYRSMPGVLVGGSMAVDYNQADWGGDRGHFSQESITGSLYAAYRGPALWATAVASYGMLSYDVHRNVPVGIAVLGNSGQTRGSGAALGGQAGYDFAVAGMKTGPFAGLLWQHVHVSGFTEDPTNFTALGFLDQHRYSTVSTLGWRVKWHVGSWQPFAQATWNHEFSGEDRTVTAFLTSAVAPSFYMPAIALGKDWGNVTAGTTVKLSASTLGVASLQSDFADNGARSFGANFGLNVRF